MFAMKHCWKYACEYVDLDAPPGDQQYLIL